MICLIKNNNTSYISTPNDHRSASLDALLYSSISGDIYWAVPTNFGFKYSGESSIFYLYFEDNGVNSSVGLYDLSKK
jgi:hypothetical protein